MPSYKPKVQILLTETYHKKFKALCELERRSESKMGEIAIERYINEYEMRNGQLTNDNSKRPTSMHIP